MGLGFAPELKPPEAHRMSLRLCRPKARAAWARITRTMRLDLTLPALAFIIGANIQSQGRRPRQPACPGKVASRKAM